MSSTDFYVSKGQLLRRAIDHTGESTNKIASSGKLSRETLRKVLGGGRITRTKAYGIINGLESYGVKLKFEEAFKLAFNDDVEGTRNNSITIRIDAGADEKARHAALKDALDELHRRHLESEGVSVKIISKPTERNTEKELEEDLAD